MKTGLFLSALLLLAGSLLLSTSQVSAAPPESPAELTIFYSNDVRGELEPCG